MPEEAPYSNVRRPGSDPAAAYQQQRLADGEACLVAALDYLSRGWSVLPLCPPDHAGVGREHGQKCGSPGKAPVVLWRGYQDRLATEAEVRAWWKRNPTANVGAALGPVSGLIRIDADGPEGERLLQEQSRGDLPPTLEFASGRPNGGRGLLYAIPPGVVLRTTTERPDAKQELRFQAKGAQTALPPSRHKDGALYAWVPGHGPGEIEPAPAPAWLLHALRPEWQAANGRAETLRDGELITEGGRNDTLTSLAGTMRRRGMGQEAIFAALLAENDQRCEPPLPEDEVRAIARSVARYDPASVPEQPSGNGRARGHRDLAHSEKPPGPKRSRTLEPYRPFPVDKLPPPIAEYVRQAAAALGCDPAYVALPALAAAASVIGNTRSIRLKRGWEEPLIIWAAIVGESGTLKSPAWRKAISYLFRLQKRLRREYKQALARYQEQLEEYRAKKRKAKDDGSDPGDPPEEPVLTRVICSDTTIEKLAEILEDNPRGTLVSRDELSAWLGSFSRYKAKGAGSDLPNWLEMFHAGTVIVDRKTGERRQIFIERAAACVTGGIQPGILIRALTLEFLEAGLAARLLLAMPVAPPKRWSEAEITPEVETAYHDLLEHLLALDFGHDANGEQVPHVLDLSREAKKVWVEFYNAWAREQANAEGELAAAFSKLEAYAARFTLLYHIVSRVARREDDVAPIEVKSVRAGIALCHWFAAEARRIYATLTEGEEDRATRKLVEYIQARGGRITARALQNSNGRKYPTVEHAGAALEALVEDGLATWEEPAAAPRGGQPARWLRLHPTADTTDTTGADGACDEDGPSDTSADTTPPNPGFPAENRGSVGSAGRRIEAQDTGADRRAGTALPGGSVGRGEVVSDGEEGPGAPWEEAL